MTTKPETNFIPSKKSEEQAIEPKTKELSYSYSPIETSSSEETEISTTLKAQYATLKRLVACLVNEHLARAYIVEEGPRFISKEYSWCYFVIVDVNNNESSAQYWFRLRHDRLPLMQSKLSRQVGYLDPEDIIMPILTKILIKYEELNDCRYITNQITKVRKLDAEIVGQLTNELISSSLHQDYAYRRQTGFPGLNARAIDWEQSIVEGHPTHPMNKARYSVAPLKEIDPTDDMLTPNIHFFVVNKSEATILGDYEQHMKDILKNNFNLINFEQEIVVPVHEKQIPNILEKFPQARQLDHIESARAQVSLRTVVLDSMPHLNLKLALGIKITSAMRTITPWTTFIGPHFKSLADQLNDHSDILKVINESGSFSINHPDPDVAKHLSCIIREDVQFNCPGERVIIAAALVEKDVNGDYILPVLLKLETEQSKFDFLDSYVKLFIRAFATPVFKYGMTFEAHLQNVLVRFKFFDNKFHLIGFAVRDFGGIQVHAPTLFETTGLTLNVWNQEACQLASSYQSLHHVAFHTMFQMHLHRFIRALDLHYNGIGWNIVYSNLDQILPINCLTRSLWLESHDTDAKSFITMKLEGLYRDYLYTKIPNLITYYKSS